MGSTDKPKVLNFAAGPSKLPEEVIAHIAGELDSYRGTGISILAMSHRSADFLDIVKRAEQSLRQILSIPDNYKVLFLQGGGTGQFAAVPLNLLRNGKADYIVTGTWSDKASKEAKKYLDVNVVNQKPATYTSVPDPATWNMSPDADYLYYCANETVHGVEFPEVPPCPEGIPLVSDMSSNFLTKKFDVTKFGLVMAGAQKNIGPAGVTVVIVRDDLIGKAHPHTPTIWDYASQAKESSVANTPCTFAIYATGLVLDWIIQQGGLEEMERRCAVKSSLIFDAINGSGGFYVNPVDAGCRSRVNVPFRIGGPTGDAALEKEFLAEAEKLGMKNLKGHRSVGGIRASLYNAVTIEETKALCEFMDDFRKRKC